MILTLRSPRQHALADAPLSLLLFHLCPILGLDPRTHGYLFGFFELEPGDLDLFNHALNSARSDVMVA